MKQFLSLICLFLLVACKNGNTISSDQPFDTSIYSSIYHREDQSVLRQKLLNLTLENVINKNHEIDDADKIEEDDEFQLVGGKYNETLFNKEEYKNYKMNMAEVIVSYNERLDIYFIPSGTSRNRFFSESKIVAEPEANFYWSESEGKVLLKNKVYYLISATKKNLKENDANFNDYKLSLGNSYNDKVLSFRNNQIVELEMDVDYLSKETAYSHYSGQSMKCTRDMQEAGVCEICSYKLENSTGRYVKKTIENIEFLNMEILINNVKYKLTEFNPAKTKDGMFKVVFNFKKMMKDDVVIIQIHQEIPEQITKKVSAIYENNWCVNKNINNMIDVTPMLKVSLDLKIKGRELHF